MRMRQKRKREEKILNVEMSKKEDVKKILIKKIGWRRRKKTSMKSINNAK